MSGVGCVQSDCLQIANAKYSYTSACICLDGFKGCYEPIDSSGIDCDPFCPASKLIACVAPDAECPAARTAPGPAGPETPDLVRDLEEFLAGEGVTSPSQGAAAAAGGAIAALLGAWILMNLLAGVPVQDLLKAISTWRHGKTPAKPEKETEAKAPEEKEEAKPQKGTLTGKIARRGLAVATLRALSAALAQKLGRPPTPEEIREAIKAGRLPPRKEIIAELRKWAEQSEQTKGWGSRLADWADGWLNKALPPTIAVYNPRTGKYVHVPNPNIGAQLGRILLSGFVDTLRVGEGYAEALRILEPKKRTFGQAAWDWTRACWHIVTDTLRVAQIAKGVSTVGKGIAGLLKPKPKLPVIKGPLYPGRTPPPHGVGTGRHLARRAVGTAGVEGQLAEDTCSYSVERNVTNDLLGTSYTEKQLFWRTQSAQGWGYSGHGRGAPFRGLTERFKSHGLRVENYNVRAVEGMLPGQHFQSVTPDFVRVNLRYPNTAVTVSLRRGGANHMMRVLEVHGKGASAVVKVYNPASATPGVGRIHTMTWQKFHRQLTDVLLVTKPG
jgi:hypothetical protein